MASNVAEGARTRGFPSPSLGGFGFIVSPTNYSRKLSDRLTGNIFGTFLTNLVCPLFSKADVQIGKIWVKLMSAFGQERPYFTLPIETGGVATGQSTHVIGSPSSSFSNATNSGHTDVVLRHMDLVWRCRLSLTFIPSFFTISIQSDG